MPLVEKRSLQRDPAGTAPEQRRYEVKIVGGRRVVVWQDGDNGLQQAYRPPPSRSADPLRSQVRVEQNPTIRVTPSGGGANSQYRPPPPAESPQRVPAERLVTGAGGTTAGRPQVTPSNPPQAQGAGQSIVGARQPEVTYSRSAPRRTSDVTGGAMNASFSVLPPITPTSSSKQLKKLGELQEITLKNELYRSSELLHERRVQRILNELRTLDRDRDGVLTPSHVRHTLHKHQLTLTPEAEDSLVTKFSESSEAVRYEKLIQYLSSVRLEASRTVPPQGQSPPKAQAPAPRLGRAFTERDDSRLKEDLAAYLKPRPLDLDQLSRTFYDLDRDRNGFLSTQQVETGLHRCGLEDMPQELLARLCTATDKQGNGLCDIDKLTAYLGRASPGASRASGSIQGIGNNHRPRRPKEPPPVISNSGYRPPQPAYQPRLADQEPEGVPENSARPESAGAIPYDTAYPPSPPTPEFDRDQWMADYQHLVTTLGLSGAEDGGYLAPDEVGRITESYNTIYNLGIPIDLVNRALGQSAEPTYGMVQLATYTDVLMNLFLNSV
ncbi:uncharacterized protein LOC122369164 [Amphibalanus amphitrite]|uniref:uncharacterized protein LOC122369164 n=2 Tax=Amphibalanus amphitrite TaxID=1232801 RepID=UPI001C8FB5D2|nr:uncharacterized protein LOC122369164 [Amphibalanus amphitrite]